MTPFLWTALGAVLVLIIGLAMLLGRGGSRDDMGRKTFRFRPVRRLFGLLLSCCACVSVLLALSLVQFFRLTTDLPVATVKIHQQGDNQYQIVASATGLGTRDYTVYGDEWQIDAKVVRWKLPALVSGAPPMYRLERLSGRYRDVQREQSGTRSIYVLDDWPAPDISAVKSWIPNWLPFVDVTFGSAAYMPMFDGASYEVLFDQRGALFIRPGDSVTADGLKQRGW